MAAPEALVASRAEYLATVRARLGVNAEWSKVDERERVRERRRKKRKGGGDDDNGEGVERDAAPAVMLGRGSDDDDGDGIGRDGVASNNSGDDDGTALDLQAQEDLALALIRGK